jgi:hypothetical protein
VSGQSEGFEQGTSSEEEPLPAEIDAIRTLMESEESLLAAADVIRTLMECEESLLAEPDAIRTLMEYEDVGSAVTIETAFEAKHPSLENMDVLPNWSRGSRDAEGDH